MHEVSTVRAAGPPPTGVQERLLSRLALATGVAVAVAGALVLLGWAIDYTILRSHVPGNPDVKPNTGVGFILLGSALALTAASRLETLARALAGATALIGFATLAEYVFGLDLGIDELLFTDDSAVAMHPGRMAPNTAFALMAIGLALAAPALRLGRHRVDDVLAGIGAVVGWMGLIGHLADLPVLETVGSVTRIALPTAICFLAAGVGVVLAHPQRGVARLVAGGGRASPLVRRLLPAAALVPIVTALVLRLLREAGVIDAGAEILLILASTAIALIAICLSFAARLDASDRERAIFEAALAEREKRLATMVRSAHDAFVSMDSGGRITAWNPAAERTFGWSASEAIGRSVAETLVPPELRERHQTGLRRYLAGGEPVAVSNRLELPARHRDGHEFPVELSISAVVQPDGVTAFHAFMHDISERRRAEGDRGRLAVIVDSSADGIISYTLEGIVTSWNRGAESILGYSEEEIVGHPITTFVPPDGHDEAWDLIARVQRGEDVRQYDVVRMRKDGEPVDVSVSLSPIRDDDGEPIAIASNVRDISERKRYERALAERNDELARSNAELAQFADVASHDLQEPLRVISGFVQLLARRYEGRLDKDADRFIEATIAGTQRMQRLIEDLLAYSRVGRAEVSREPVSTAAAVAEATAGLQAAIDERDAEITVGELPTISADGPMLTRMFQNLIGNAVKFSDDGAPRVAVGAERGDGEWRFSVADNGPGIDPKHADRIFEMFKRLHGRSVEGTGIGLAICKRIVEHHGGAIWVEPAPEGGSDFRFTIPDASG